MMYNYYNDYPKLSDHYLYDDQEQLKSCIKQFDTAMIHSGLVRAPDTGQLDVNNIETKDLKILNQGQGTTYRDNTTTYLAYLPLVYCFTDDLQATNPVYIKLIFEIGRLRPPVINSIPVGELVKLPLGVFVSIEIGSASNGNSVLENPLLFYSGITYNGGNSTWDNNAVKMNTSYSYNNSIINYQKEHGLLYVNVCPEYRMSSSVTPDAINNTENNASLLQLLVYRVDNETIGAMGYFSHVQMNNTSQQAPNKSFKYKSGGVNYNDNNGDSFTGLYNTTSGYINGKIVLQPVAGYNPLKKKMVRNPSILLGSGVDTGYITGSTFDVIINENEKKKYFVYCPLGSGFRLLGFTNRITLLIYAGDIDNE